MSRTFHGRDIFAPCAAHLAAGVTPARFGKRIENYLRPAFQMPQRAGKRTWTGQVLKIDHFGNIITNFHVEDFPNLENQDVTFSVGPQPVTVIARNYAETGPGELFAIVGSSGFYEISISQGSAARRIGCVAGGPVELLIG